MEIFKSHSIDTISDKKLSAITLYTNEKNNNNTLIITGDFFGNIELYEITSNNKLIKSTSISIGKNKIEKLICVDSLNILYVLSNNNLFLILLPIFRLVPDGASCCGNNPQIVDFCNNLNPSISEDILIVNKKKKILLYKYNIEIQKICIAGTDKGDEDKLYCSEVPDRMLLYGKYFCYICKNKVYFKDLNTNIQYDKDFACFDIEYILGGWILNFEGTVGLFMENSGKDTMNNSPLTFTNKILTFKKFTNNYLIALYENGLEIFNVKSSASIQNINENFVSGFFGKFIISNENKCFYITTNLQNFDDKSTQTGDYKIYEIKEIPFEEQISKLLMLKEFEEALNILTNKVPINKNKFDVIEKYYNDVAWSYFKEFTKKDINESKKYFNICNFNPFEIIYLYSNLLKIKPIHEEFINMNEDDKKKNQIDIIISTKNDINEKFMHEFLEEVIKYKLKYIKKTFDVTNLTNLKIINISFLNSNCSILKLENNPNESKQYSLFTLLQFLNNALVRCKILLKSKIEEISEIIDNDTSNTDYLYDDFIVKINSFQSKMTLAMIYEKKKDYEKSLDILKEFVKQVNDPAISRHARNRAINILKNLKDKNLYEKNILWMLSSYFSNACEIQLFVAENDVVSIDYFIENIINKMETNNENYKNYYKIKFLKFLCKNEKYNNEKYQTLLIELCIDELFERKKADNNFDEKDFPEYLDLKNLLKELKKYDKIHILEKINNSWMYDIEIDLNIEIKKYDDVLKILINLVKKRKKNFIDIENFIKENILNQKNLYLDYFKILSESYNKEDNKEMYKEEMLNLLKLFVNKELIKEPNLISDKEYLHIFEPNIIFKYIPNEWQIKEKIVFDFMTYSLTLYNIINNNFNKMEKLMNIESKYQLKTLYELKNKNVQIESYSICNWCKKKIGGNIFVVYPNKHIYHVNCAPNQTIEPINGKKFLEFN